jgi:hypothetical protein
MEQRRHETGPSVWVRHGCSGQNPPPPHTHPHTPQGVATKMMPAVVVTGVRLRWRFREDDQSCLVNTSENSMHLYILSQALPYKQQVGRVWCKER